MPEKNKMVCNKRKKIYTIMRVYDIIANIKVQKDT